MEMRSWIVSVGPNPGRGSSHAHGPVTDTGPVRVVAAKHFDKAIEALYRIADYSIPSDHDDLQEYAADVLQELGVDLEGYELDG